MRSLLESKIKRYARLLLVTIGLGVLAFAMSLVPQKTATGAAAAGPLVTVTNFPATLTGAAVPASITNSSPINVAGTVTVSSLPSVALGGAVTVGNPATNPVQTRDTDNQVRQPFQTTCVTPPTLTSVATCDTNPTPADEYVVIEMASVQAFSDPNNALLWVTLTSTTAGNATNVWLNAVQQAGFDQPVKSAFLGAQSVYLPIDPGTAISCGIRTSAANPSQSFSGTCTFTGYWVSKP